MTQHGRVAFRIVSVLVIGLFSQVHVVSAQETMSATQDPQQHQDWGQWKVFNSKYPRILGRARCDYDVKVDGKWSSWWGYQFRTTSQTPVDIVFVVEYGDPSGVNKPEAPSMILNAPYESIYSGGTGIWGTCGEHTFPKTLRAKVVCAVPTGQDDPCWKDANGNPVAQAKPSDLQAAEVGARGVGVTSGASSPSKTKGASKQTQIANSAWICTGEIYGNTLNWKHTFKADGSFTVFNVTESEYEPIYEDEKWTQTGDEVAWDEQALSLHFAGKVIGNLMTVQFEGGNAGHTTGTLTCKPTDH